MSEINWNELKDKAHSNAVKHGFWEGRPSDKHFLCLVISELMEAVNAHRRNKFARVPANRKETIFDDRTFHHENKYFRENFEEYVKDTVEDELADAAIRLLDLAGANNLNLNRFCLQHVVTPKKSFTENIYAIITLSEDGLKTEWGGVRVWLNPPYSRPLIERFVEKMVRNNNGIALLFNRCDSKMFQDLIFPNASAIMFVKGRIKFYRPDGTQGDSPGCGSVLIAFGEENAKILEHSNIPGKYIKLNN